MKKLLLLLFFVLAACSGAPATEEAVVVVTKLVAAEPEIIEVPGETVYIEVTPTPLPAPEMIDDGILYLPVNQHTVLWELVGETEDGLPIFERYRPLYHLDAGNRVVAYSGHGPDEFFRVSGGLAMSDPSFPNAQDFICTEEYVLPIWVYDDPTNTCSSGLVRTALFPGRWVGQWIDVEGNLRSETYFYKLASVNSEMLLVGPGLYILADRVDVLDCEALDFPPRCNQ